jgi:hypothetical protein
MNRKNTRKERFLESLPTQVVEGDVTRLKDGISFQFSYFDPSQPAGQAFQDWSQDQLAKLLDKLRAYSRESRIHWERERIGQGKNHVLEIYGRFPSHSDFIHPKHVPADVEWARFRLEGDSRLIGFMVNRDQSERFGLQTNVFYVVFLDAYHRFYKG